MTTVTSLPSVRHPLLMDGAMGTSLVTQGLGRDVLPCLACLDAPHQVESLHREYARAGARAFLTNTFVATRGHLETAGRAREQRGLIEAAVRIARSAAQVLDPGSAGADRILVVGDLGPAARPGRLEAAAREAPYRQVLEVFASTGIDGLLLETFHDPEDLSAALDARDAILPHLPVLVSLSGSQDRLEALEVLLSRLRNRQGVAAVGLNCWSTPEGLRAGFQVLRDLHSGPYMARPSRPAAGSQAWLDLCLELVEAGVSWIGGCCGTTPADIAALATRLHGTAGARSTEV